MHVTENPEFTWSRGYKLRITRILEYARIGKSIHDKPEASNRVAASDDQEVAMPVLENLSSAGEQEKSRSGSCCI